MKAFPSRVNCSLHAQPVLRVACLPRKKWRSIIAHLLYRSCSRLSKTPLSLVNLIKRPRIPKTAIPNLIHHSLRVLQVFTPRPRRHAQTRSPPHTLLQLLRNPPLSSCEKLPSPPTLARKCRSSDLRASSVAQIIHSVHLEAKMVKRMHHLVRKRVLHVSAIAHLVRADHYAVFRVETAALLVVASRADYL